MSIQSWTNLMHLKNTNTGLPTHSGPVDVNLSESMSATFPSLALADIDSIFGGSTTKKGYIT